MSHPWSLLQGGDADPPPVASPCSAPGPGDGDQDTEVISSEAEAEARPSFEDTAASDERGPFHAYLESLFDGPEGEADWYASVALESGPTIGGQMGLMPLQEAPEPVLVAPILAAPYDELDVQREAAEASSRVFAANLPRQAWEGPNCLSYSWERPAKRKATVLGFLDVVEPSSEDVTEDKQLGKLPPVVRSYLRRLPVARENSDERTHALKRLKFLIMWDPDATKLAASLSGAATRQMDDAVVQQSFSDAFRSKATGTLSKRVGSLERFFRWATDNQISSPFSVGEDVVYDYLNHLRSEGSAATSASHFVEALRFLHGTTTLNMMDVTAVLSSRVQGVARDMFLGKRPLEQKPQLTVVMVVSLEEFCGKAAPQDAVVCGQILFCLHSGARWSDGQRLKSIELQEQQDETILIADALGAKTATSKEAKTRLIPYVAIGSGLRHNWARAWLQARKELGFNFDGFAQPAWLDSKGSWGNVEMDAAQATFFLQEFLLKSGIDQGEALKRTSHSLKATLTTWASRCPTVSFSRAEQRLLGHHMKPKDRSPLTYSRQAFTNLYGKVLLMFHHIREGKYDPDLSEVGRILEVARAGSSGAERAGASGIGIEAPAASSSSGESSAGSGDKDSEASGEEECLHRVPFREPVNRACLKVHRLSGIVHHLKEGADDQQFFCGRFLSDRYMPFSRAGPASVDPDFCVQCQKARDG